MFEIRSFSPDVPVVLAVKQVGQKEPSRFLLQEIGAFMHLTYSGDDSNKSIDNIFEKSVRMHLMKTGILN